MAPNPKVVKAFLAMRNIGIPEEKVKPVLKNLIKLYEHNWALIEQENYRVLADAIFDTDEMEAEENKKQESTEHGEDLEEEAEVHDEPEPPLKRLRLRHQEGQASPSFSNPSPGLGGISFKSSEVEGAELPETRPQHESRDIQSPQSNSTNIRIESQPVSPYSLGRNIGKQPVSPKSLAIRERSEPSQPDLTNRTESSSVRDRGQEPLLLQYSSREKMTISERSSHGPNVEPGIILLPKQKMSDTRALIRPRDESSTYDMPQIEVPIAVIHPESSHKEDYSIGNGPTGESNGPEPLVSQSRDGTDKNDGTLASSNEMGIFELANIAHKSTANIDIASSPSGDVKISLNCNTAHGRPNFRMPSLDDLLKAVEDKCLRSYKVLDPNFSLAKLLKDMCECFAEIATDSTNESQEIMQVTPANNLLKEYCAMDPLNGSVGIQCGAEVPPHQIPELAAPCNGMGGLVQVDDNSCKNNGEINKELELSNCQSLVVVQQRQLTPDDIRAIHDASDIAKGQERVSILLVNEINTDVPPAFQYIPQNAVFQNAHVKFSLACIGDDDCCSTCFGNCLSSLTPCACAHETGGEFAYTLEGLVKEEFLEECISMNRDPPKHCQYYCQECPLERSKNEVILEPCKGHLIRKFIKECWWKCGCSRQCGNRMVQRGISCKLQVFMASGGKGWGLRTLEDLPKGAFVCEYVGEVLTNTELYNRVSRSNTKEEHAYPVLLDADWGSEGVLKDEKALFLDATYYGNVARFINHRCFDPNLVEIPVEVETPDHHYYHLAFFTSRKVDALEELTWDYGIHFDDHDHPVKAFWCRCGSKFCRNIER